MITDGAGSVGGVPESSPRDSLAGAEWLLIFIYRVILIIFCKKLVIPNSAR